ncbi:MAG: hypothetical protein IT328_18360 [Caldilineaceae bacterium]|nr:hypothetical protein [Caldilineaceae bacterium]
MLARIDYEDELEPLVVSHGWSRPHDEQSKFLDNFNWTGTMDPSAYISVGAAIRFQREHNWHTVRAACHHSLAKRAAASMRSRVLSRFVLIRPPGFHKCLWPACHRIWNACWGD